MAGHDAGEEVEARGRRFGFRGIGGQWTPGRGTGHVVCAVGGDAVEGGEGFADGLAGFEVDAEEVDLWWVLDSRARL